MEPTSSSGDEEVGFGVRARGRAIRVGREDTAWRRYVGATMIVVGASACCLGVFSLLSPSGGGMGNDVVEDGAHPSNSVKESDFGSWWKHLVKPPHPAPAPHPHPHHRHAPAPAPDPWNPPAPVPNPWNPPAPPAPAPPPGNVEVYSDRRRRSTLPSLPDVLPAPDYTSPKAPVYEFYLYRAQSDKDYDLENVNMANIAGVMWYLHNEIVPDNCNRRFDIRRILRVKVRTTATPELWARKMDFGVRYAFDSGKCTGPENCENTWKRYGYVVGCNNLGDFPYPMYETFYPRGIWYSFPGRCSQREFASRVDGCELNEHGGKCEGTPTGSWTCTYSIEPAGDINIDDLVGIHEGHENFCNRGCYEYKRSTQAGSCTDFWNQKWNREKNEERVRKAIKLFAEKYPDMNATIPEPPCDFDNARAYPPNGLSGRPAP